MALSDQQMLILDNLMYSNITTKCANENLTLNDVILSITGGDKPVKAKDLKGFKLSGKIDKKEMADVLNAILEDDDLSSLKIGKSIDDGIRATCFVDDSGHATVAFRGTGGYLTQWGDDFEGFGDTDTPAQLQAYNYIKDLPYDNIDVTGHSKGGNIAKYVTIRCGEKIGRCVSYEGQGFSNEFYLKYMKSILKNQNKIKQISADNDAVNPALRDISLNSNTYYYDEKGNYTHGKILKKYKEKGFFDSKGTFIDKGVKRSKEAEAINVITVYISDMSMTSIFHHQMWEKFTDVLGLLVGTIISVQKAKDDENAEYIDLGRYFEYLLIEIGIELDNLYILDIISGVFYKNMKIVLGGIGTWIDLIIRNNVKLGISYASEHTLVEVDTDLLRQYAARIDKLKKKSKQIDDRIAGMYQKVGFLDLLKLLDAGLFDLTQSRLGKVHNYLIETAEEFEKVESELSGI